ncbi:MAG: Crp/Fnr family transcriptional regulator [Firmicutes bacterium]|nr:Crp/Fnr family transcriptional regulator [Bacillota bacterium]
MTDNRKPPFQSTPEDDTQYHLMYLPRGISRLEKLGETVSVEAGTEINKIDEVPECCYIIKSGRVQCYEYSYAGEQRIYNIMEPGSVVLEECLLFDKACPILFKTLTPSELIRIEKCDLKRAFKHDIDIVMDICESISNKFLSSMEHLRLSHNHNASWKICRILLTYARHYGTEYDGKTLITEKISQQMLADLLGLNRITVTRRLKELKELALIEVINGYFCIRDIDQLKNHMESLEMD